ncbi:hypothetical protein HID58_061210 [Brassica napus]|uniref:Replication factor A C-terminal domain-containing protein n=1 Tax=Brassica napus TaxID=3708 RepID=A0ABQ7ZY15_BRANA|nr:hypothetical protein HID58_061210 [Brassica napus]
MISAARHVRAVIRASKRRQPSTRGQCSSSNGDTDVLHRPWLNEIYRVPESSHNNNQASSIPSGSAKKARFLRKALCVRKKESQFTQSSDNKEYLQLYIFDTDNELENRKRAFTQGSSSLAIPDSIIVQLIEMMDKHNHLAKTFRHALFLSDLQAGHSSSTVEVRLLRSWDARTLRRGGERMSVEMLLLDSQATMMPASVNVNRLATHQTNLEAGTVYSLTGFEVTRCNQDYRLSDSSLLIRFTDSTTFEKITDPAVPIPLESFRFRNYSEMLRLANSNNQLPDLIGKITAVKSTITEPPLDKNRVSATIKMDNDTSVTLTLFDAQAVKIHNQLAQMAVDPRICVATSVNPRMVGGRLFFNGTAGTHIHFDVETVAGESLFSSGLLEQDTGLAPVGRLVRSFAKVETLSIAELNDFVLNASSQNIDFICTGKVTGIKLDKGWCYVSCAKCFRKLHRSVSSLTCLSCNNTDAVGILRYRVEISIADETGEGLFVAFDGVMAKLHNMRAHEAVNLLPGNDVNPEESDAPQFVLDMEGNTYTFQVKVGPYNFTANNHSFTISRILGEGDPEPQPAFVDDGAADDNGDDNNDV